MHGLATLWLAGNLRAVTDDPIALARSIATSTFSSGASRTRGLEGRPAKMSRREQ
jgi:hypothetical protein